MRALLVGDIHLSDRPPSIRRESYADEIFAKLEQTVDIATFDKVDCVIWAGDVFHIKTPSRTSHELVQRTADLGQSYTVPWLIVPGNHDMQHDRIESLPQQPLGVLFKAGAVPLMGRPDPDLPVFGIPFLNNYSRDLKLWTEKWRADDADLMVTHAPIVPPENSLPYEVIKATAWAETMKRSGDVYYGHMHHCDGAYLVRDELYTYTFCNQGAISRGSLHEETLARSPAITVYDSEKREVPEELFRRVELVHKPAEEVFRLTEHREGEARQERLDDFLTSIGETKLTQMSAEAVVHDLETKNLKPATMREVRECIEFATT